MPVCGAYKKRPAETGGLSKETVLQKRRSNLCQGLLQVGQQVVDVLDAHATGAPCPRSRRPWPVLRRDSWRCVVEAGWVASELHVADVDQAGEQLERVQEARTAFAATAGTPKVSRPEAWPPRYFCTRAWSGWSGRPA